MAMANVDLKKALAEYRKVSADFKKAEDRRKDLKAVIMDEMEVRGIPYVQGEKSKSKTMEVQEYAAVVTSYGRESIGLEEAVREFGREMLEAKKLINEYPVESLRVALIKPKK